LLEALEDGDLFVEVLGVVGKMISSLGQDALELQATAAS
jgi:hypothetical protein